MAIILIDVGNLTSLNFGGCRIAGFYRRIGDLMEPPSTTKALDLFLRGLLGHTLLDENDRSAIRALPSKTVKVAAHRDFRAAGGRADTIGLVVRGLVGKCRDTKAGSRQIMSLHLPGDMLDLSSLILREAQYPLVTLAPSTIALIPRAALRDLAAKWSSIAAALLRDCMVHASIATQWLFNIGSLPAHSRVAHFFCEISCRAFAREMVNDATFRLPMTQAQLGEALGLTSVHVNRTLRRLRDEQLLAVDRGLVTVLDWDGLTRAADFDSAYLHLPLGGDGPLANSCAGGPDAEPAYRGWALAPTHQ